MSSELLESIPLAALIINRSSQIGAINSLATAILEYSGGIPQGANLNDMLDGTGRMRIKELIGETLEHGSAELDELVLTGSRGSMHYLRLFSSIYTDSGRDSILILAALADSRRKERDELLMLQSETSEERSRRSELLSRLGHELKNPVKSLVQITALLKEELERDQRPEALAYLRTIQRSASEIRRLAEDFQNFVALDSREMVPEKLIFSFPGLVRELRETYGALAREKGLEFFVRNELEEPGMFEGDPRRIKQILSSLITNAVEYTREGQIDLIIREESLSEYLAEITVEVRDTGPGLDPKLQQFIWEDEADGGIGLPIARRLAGIMNAQIYYQSAINFGTSFFFTLPLPRSLQTGISSPQLEAPTVRSFRILMAAPAGWTSYGLINEFSRNGHMIISTSKYDELGSGIERGNYDALIINIDDEAEAGGDMIRSLRSGAFGESGRDIPVIALTANIEAKAELEESIPCDEIIESTAEFDTLNYLLMSIIH